MNNNVGDAKSRKIYLYGAHDTNIGALARSLGIPNHQIPAYGSTIIFEKLRDKEGSVYVRVSKNMNFYFQFIQEYAL